MMHYVALVRKDDDSDYGVDFPDFPGCISAGETIEEALVMGREALLGHIAVMAESGEATPPPSDLDSILADPHNCEGLITTFMVLAPSSTEKAVRINITIPEGALRQIDDYVGERGISRSAFLVESALKELHS